MLTHLIDDKKAKLMSKLYFRYGAMNSGKSTALLQVAYNYQERGQIAVIAKPTIDTKDVNVLSRIGMARPVDIHVSPETDMVEAFLELGRNKQEVIDCLIVDEAQFLSPSQINGLFNIAVGLNVPVLAYGLRTDFQGKAFPGSLRLLEIAHSLEEMKTICRCGRKALFNGRKLDGVFVREGAQVAIDGQHAEYESLCGQCFIEKVGPLN